MTTPGMYSILLTAMLAWSPPAVSHEGRPVGVQAPGLSGRMASSRRCPREQGGRDRLPGDRMPAGEPLCPEARRAGASLREEGRGVLRRRRQPAGRPFGAGAVRPGARPAVPTAERRGERAGRPARRRADAGGLRPRRRSGSCAIAAGWTTSSASASTARPRPGATWPRRSTTCSRAGRWPRRGPSLPAAGSAGSPKAKGDGAVNYSKQVARILRDRCVACHREGEIAPFSLASYKQAAGWAEMIDEVVQAGRMPPWHASPEYG